MKSTELLKEQHAEVKKMFLALEKGNGHSVALVEKLATSLGGHMVIEQELFYPAALEVKKDLVLESYEEHAVARFALKRLMKTESSDPSFKARVTTLKELIEHHVEEEEEDLFPKVEKALGKDASEELGARMKALFDKTVLEGGAKLLGREGEAVTSGHAPLGTA